MEICRVVKTKDYTVMSNYHLRDRRLSAKEMGLLSFVLSLPDDWDFTIRGLIGLMRDGKDSIYGALRNLEAFGYVRRRQRRNAKGQLSRVEYSFFEQPQTAPQPPEKLEIPAFVPRAENPEAVPEEAAPEADNAPHTENPEAAPEEAAPEADNAPHTENPEAVDSPLPENPHAGNPSQRNTKLTNNILSYSSNLSILVSTTNPAGITDGQTDDVITDREEEKPVSFAQAVRWVKEHSDDVGRQHFEQGTDGDREYLAYRGTVEALAGLLISRQPWEVNGIPVTADEVWQKAQEVIRTDDTLYFLLRDTAERFAKAIAEIEVKSRQGYLRSCLWNNLQLWVLEYYSAI